MSKRKSVGRYPPTDEFISIGELKARWHCSHMFIEARLEKDKTFPRPYRFGDAPTAWRFWKLSEIEKWEKTRIVREAA